MSVLHDIGLLVLIMKKTMVRLSLCASGTSCTATDQVNWNRVNEQKQLSVKCSISRERVQAITVQLGFRKVCA